MKIGDYAFEEFVSLAEKFHGFPAPGLVVAGYMTEKIKTLLPPQTKVNAIAETAKCLPDAIQMLAGCTIGNGKLKVFSLGLYAMSLYNKENGEGHRVWLDRGQLDRYPELKSWYLKLKPKQEQDFQALMDQILDAGSSICLTRPITVRPEFLVKRKEGEIATCPICHEAYPKKDGGICRSCQGEAPYVSYLDENNLGKTASPQLHAVAVEDAVGKKTLHDMTMIVPGVKKGAEFEKGQEITCSDINRLKKMGRRSVYTDEQASVGDEWVHENEAAQAFGAVMSGEGVAVQGPPSEGKVNLIAARDGVFKVDESRLEQFNFIPDVMCACRKGYGVVKQGTKLAGSRAIPLFLRRDLFERCMSVLRDGPLFQVAPLRQAKVGILITGNEVFDGTIQDKFRPIIEGKVMKYGCEVVKTIITPDDRTKVKDGALALIDAGADLLVTTAGLSVDPDDVTRLGLTDAGASDILYGAPILPGAMTLLARIGSVQVIGVPACALFFKTTSFDILLPRLLAGLKITRKDLTRLANGAMCHECKDCTYPKCSFGK